MIRAWTRFRALNRGDRRLVLEAATVLAAVWAGLRVLSFPSLRQLLDRYSRHADPSLERARPAVDRIGWAVAAVARRSPVSMTCLVQALAADGMLRRRGHTSTLHIGVRLHRHSSTPLQAHAWVKCEDQIVVGVLDDLSEYAVLAIPSGS